MKLSDESQERKDGCKKVWEGKGNEGWESDGV